MLLAKLFFHQPLLRHCDWVVAALLWIGRKWENLPHHTCRRRRLSSSLPIHVTLLVGRRQYNQPTNQRRKIVPERCVSLLQAQQSPGTAKGIQQKQQRKVSTSPAQFQTRRCGTCCFRLVALLGKIYKFGGKSQICIIFLVIIQVTFILSFKKLLFFVVLECYNNILVKFYKVKIDFDVVIR